MIIFCRENVPRTASTALGNALGSAVLRRTPGPPPAASRVGQQPVLDLRLAALAVPGVPVGGQLAVAALHPGGGQAGHRDAALVQVPGGQLLLDVILAGDQPVHRGVDVVGGRAGHAQVGAEGHVVPPAGRGQLGRRAQDPRDDQRVGQVPLRAGRAEQGREAERAGHRVHGGGVPVRQRPGDLERGARVDQGRAGQHRADRGDRLGRQVRQVRQGLLADLAAVPERAAQQVPLVARHRPVLTHLMATGGFHVHRACPACHRAILARASPVNQLF